MKESLKKKKEWERKAQTTDDYCTQPSQAGFCYANGKMCPLIFATD